MSAELPLLLQLNGFVRKTWITAGCLQGPVTRRHTRHQNIAAQVISHLNGWPTMEEQSRRANTSSRTTAVHYPYSISCHIRPHLSSLCVTCLCNSGPGISLAPDGSPSKSPIAVTIPGIPSCTGQPLGILSERAIDQHSRQLNCLCMRGG